MFLQIVVREYRGKTEQLQFSVAVTGAGKPFRSYLTSRPDHEQAITSVFDFITRHPADKWSIAERGALSTETFVWTEKPA
jgi:hypothetical protein